MAAMLLCSVGASAETLASGSCGENLTWTLTEEGELIIEGEGEMTNYGPRQTPWFGHRTLIKQISMGAGVTSIGDYAFYGLTELLTVDISKKVSSIGNYAFYGCGKLTSVDIPTLLTAINYRAFSKCGLTSVTIPEGVKSIDDAAFELCSNLTSVTLPQSLTDIASMAFVYCENLKDIVIPSNVTSIGRQAFDGCSSLTSITVPENSQLTSIGDYAFSDCSSLTSITIPEGVTSIRDLAFSSCSSLTSIVVAEGNTVYDSRGGCNAIIETSSNTLIQGCSTTIIPESVTSIGSYAFYDCSSLTSITIPEGVTSIGERAFYGCSGELTVNCNIPSGGAFYNSEFTKVTIGEGVTSIGDHAFSGCSSLTSITIPEGVTSIGSNAFDGCSSLTSIVVAEGNTVYDSRGGCNAIIETSSNTLIQGCSTTIIPESVTSIGSYAFYDCSSLTSITIPEGVTTMGSYAFSGCSSLSSITCYAGIPPTGGNAYFSNVDKSIPIYVTASSISAYKTAEEWKNFTNYQPLISYIASGTCGTNLTWRLTEEGELIIEGIGAMFDYPSLQNVPWYDYAESIQSVVVQEGVNSIGSRAFACCENLASVSIPEGVVSIGERAYMDCSGLTSVRIPTSVTEIGMYAFSGCDKITDFYIGNIEWWLDYGVKGFTHEGNTNLFIGDDLLTDLVIPSTVNSIPSEAFRNCNSIETVKFDNGVTEIGDRAFQNCSNLISVDIPESMCQIGQDAFEGTAWYDNHPDGVLYVGNWLYGYKGEMPEDFELVVQEGTMGIVDYAFEECTNLIRVTIPGSTRHIGMAAFISSGLILATMSEGVKSIGGGAFWGCRSLNDVAIPESVMEVGDEAFAETAWYGKQPCGVLYLSNWAVGVKTCGDWDLSNISIFEGVKGMAEGVIRYDCQSVIIPESVVYLSRAFELANPSTIVCKALTPPKGVDEKTFERAKNSSTLYVPAASVNAYIADEYWGDFENIKAIDFPVWSLTTEGELIVDGVGTMEDYEYEYTPWYIYHSSIKSVTIKEGIASVGDEAFAYCEELASVSLPNSLLSLGEGAFAECYRLSSVVIPENVTTIGSGAFYSAGLSSIICRSMTPPVIADRTTFYYVSKSIPVYVPLSSVEAYNDADYWNEFTNIQPMPETITINQYGSATYCSEYALDFSEVEGLKAYAATGYKTSTGVITLTRVMTANAGVGLFLKGEPGEYTVPVLESTDENSLNMLVGTLESTEVNSTSSDGLYANFRYTIKDGDETPLFYRVDDGYTLGAGKAYLQIPVAWMPAEAKSISLRFDDGATTDIENDAELENQNSELEIYDLMGRRVSTPQRGSLYLINGKKIIY